VPPNQGYRRFSSGNPSRQIRSNRSTGSVTASHAPAPPPTGPGGGRPRPVLSAVRRVCLFAPEDDAPYLACLSRRRPAPSLVPRGTGMRPEHHECEPNPSCLEPSGVRLTGLPLRVVNGRAGSLHAMDLSKTLDDLLVAMRFGLTLMPDLAATDDGQPFSSPSQIRRRRERARRRSSSWS
jgi:hypothetical protein